VFLSDARRVNGLAATLDDASGVISIALQHGIFLATGESVFALRQFAFSSAPLRRESSEA
jgi:hypothetical protein